MTSRLSATATPPGADDHHPTSSGRSCSASVGWAPPLSSPARHAPLFDQALVTLGVAQAAQAVRLLGARRAVVAHTDG